MTPSQKYLEKLGLKDEDKVEEPIVPQTEEKENSRRSFFKKSTMGGIALGGAYLFSPIEDLVAQSTQKVSKAEDETGQQHLNVNSLRRAHVLYPAPGNAPDRAHGGKRRDWKCWLRNPPVAAATTRGGAARAGHHAGKTDDAPA